LATWQQKKKLATFHSIYEAFIEDTEKPPTQRKLKPRNWNELAQKIPEATLSRNLKELMKKGYITWQIEDSGKGPLKRVYEWNGERVPPVFEFKDDGKLKFAVKHCRDGKAYAGWGQWVHPPGMKPYFRFKKGKTEI